MNADITYHYPPELMNLLVNTIPLLNKSKNDVFLFFRGAGVSPELMSEPYSLWLQDKKLGIGKYDIVRKILESMNRNGEACLRERREVLRRVVEFDNFSGCWESDQLKAKGLVAEIRSVVNVKDSFTRMNEEREKASQLHREQRAAEARKQEERLLQIENLKKELFSLFGMSDHRQRGKKLEDILNRLFSVFGILVREAFHLTGNEGEGIIEQIDGLIEIDGHLYFVEMKWWNHPLGVPEVSQHLVRVYGRSESRAIIISASSFSDAAISTCRDALSQKVVTLTTIEEIVKVLEHQVDLGFFLRKKVYATIADKNPFPIISLDQF